MIEINFDENLCNEVSGKIDYNATLQISLYTTGTTMCATDYTCCCSFCGK